MPDEPQSVVQASNNGGPALGRRAVWRAIPSFSECLAQVGVTIVPESIAAKINEAAYLRIHVAR